MKQRIHVPTAEEAKDIIFRRLESAQQDRLRFEPNWSVNERAVFTTHRQDGLFEGTDTNPNYFNTGAGDASNSEDSRINLPYAFKNLRFIHAQMSANPPSVTTQPATSNQDDRDRAESADLLVQWGRRQYSFSEIFELSSLDTLLYGTGFIKEMWDGSIGEPLSVNTDDTIDMSGDISVTIPSPWDMWLDPDAKRWDEVRWCFQRIMLSYEEACSRWPEHKKLFKKMMGQTANSNSRRAIHEKNHEMIELAEYWERGEPYNGYLGKYAVITFDGILIEAPRPNPHRFKSNKGIEVAELPYKALTDIDIPSTVWGKSSVDYAVNLQDVYNMLLSHTFDAIKAHGNVRMVIPGGQEMEEDISNSNWEIYQMTGTQPPHFVQPPQLMPDINQLEQSMKVGIDDMMGINDAMQGKFQRETAGFAMQYAASQGNLIRRRLMNKYTLTVEWSYKTFLKLIRDNWDTEQTIQVVGKDNAIESLTISGMDIDGGFDLIVEYGSSMSLDPLTRREEIMAMMPIFEKAGVDQRTILKMLHLSELKGIYDLLDLAEQRQREIFETIIASDGEIYIEPEEFEDHENMLAYGLYFVMKPEYQALDDKVKELIRQHLRDRKALAGQEKAEGSGAPMGEMAGAEAGMPGVSAPGPEGGMVGAPEEASGMSPAMTEIMSIMEG